eukprot:COSAG01_NODE_4786_length_4745_cov_95.210073_5_plen_73_part_00
MWRPPPQIAKSDATPRATSRHPLTTTSEALFQQLQAKFARCSYYIVRVFICTSHGTVHLSSAGRLSGVMDQK